MKIYLDVIFFINFIFDLLLLLTVSIILKKKIKILRLILSTLFGSLSIFFLFININSVTLFFLKFLISVIMILILFGKKDFKRNMLFLYFTSILLGGFLYFINMQFSYKNEGLVFFYNGFSLNIILLLILSPIILFYYYKQSRYFKDTLNNIYNVEIVINGKSYFYQGYLDTGNKLKEPYKGREVNIVYDKKLLDLNFNFLIIPYQCVGYSGLLKGIQIDKMIINNSYIILEPFIAISENDFNLENCEIILNSNLKSRLN